jgi:hypothetical protein
MWLEEPMSWTLAVLLALVASWAIATRIGEVVVAFWLREGILGEWLVALAGVAQIALVFALKNRVRRHVVARPRPTGARLSP